MSGSAAMYRCDDRKELKEYPARIMRERRIAAMLLVITLLLALSAASTAQAAIRKKTPRPLCPEGSFIMMPNSEYSGQDIYTADGKWTCSYPTSFEAGPPVTLFPGKLLCTDYDQGIFLNLQTGKQLGPFGGEEINGLVQGNYLVLEDMKRMVTTVYDADGETLISLPYTGEARMWDIDGTIYILMENGEGVDVWQYDAAAEDCIPVEGACFRQGSIWEFEEISRLGENYLLSGSGEVRVVSPSWDIVYRSAGYTFYNRPPLQDYAYDDISIQTVKYFVSYENAEAGQGSTVYHVLDENLQEVLSMPEEAWYEVGIDCRDGILIGIPCDALEGRICAGLMTNDWKTVPYAKEGNTYWFSTENGVVSVTLPEGQTPQDINKRFLLTMDADWNDCLYDLQTGKEIQLPAELYEMMYQLGETGVAAYGWTSDVEAENPDDIDYDDRVYSSVLYDLDLKEIARPAFYRGAYPWYDGLWYCQNDLMRGFIDIEGRWVMRRWDIRD